MSFIEGLHTLIRSGKDLPTLPAVVFQLHAVLDDESAGIPQVAAVIERDPALTTRLLRAANSVLYSRGPDRVASVMQAAQRVGLGQVRALCLVLSVVKLFRSRHGGLPHDDFWAHSAAVGAAARFLAQRTTLTGLAGDDVYTAGLLHDVGLLVLDQFFPAEFDTLAGARDAVDLPLWQHEEDYLGMDHGEVGGLMLGHWSLPATVIEGVRYHHRPAEAPAEHRAMAAVVHAAEIAVGELGGGLAVEGTGDEESRAALLAIGLAPDEWARHAEGFEDVVRRARELFR